MLSYEVWIIWKNGKKTLDWMTDHRDLAWSYTLALNNEGYKVKMIEKWGETP